MKVVLAFDSFKGSLSSLEAGKAAARAVRSVLPDAECDVIPLADGGEGTVDALVYAAGGSRRTLQVTGPLGQAVTVDIGLIEGEATAVLEIAAICGLTMVPTEHRDPYRTTSRGVGEAITALLDEGIRSFVVGLGGSATNDGGMGMLAALGAAFLDDDGSPLYGYGDDLLRVAFADLSGLDPRLQACALKIATDVSNPLCGKNGASMVYGKQKGASPEQQARLDLAMVAYADLVEKHTGISRQGMPGAGAAGGLGFAMLALGGDIVSGGGWLIDAVGLRGRILDADWVITGEGRSDNQTLYGKLPIQVAAAASEACTRCMLVSGSLGDELDELERRFHGCFSIVKEPASLEQCMEQAEPLLEQAVRRLFMLLRAAR